jgi:hypothetical protein
MEDRRQESRFRAELCVQVSGTDAQGEGFKETVVATSLSRSGALLTKVRAELRCGDLIAIDHNGRHAYFRIVWVLNSGMLDGRQVAIHKLKSQLCPWEELLPAEPVLATNLDGNHG